MLSVRPATVAFALCLALGPAAASSQPAEPGLVDSWSRGGVTACASAEGRPGYAQRRRLIRAMLCLVNRERRERGRAPVRFQPRLGRAATRHARDMVRRRYFSHISPSGAQVTDRVRASGYLRAGSRYVVGENLAWGTEARATPRATVEAWMRSGSHRLVLLHPRFREFGVGLARGVPIARHSDAPSPATWVLLLGALD